jgi:hypothetical protein
MRRTLGLMILAGLVAIPASAQKVAIDYAHDFDFEAVKSFEYVDTMETNATESLMAGRVRDMIIKELEEGGLQQVDSDPDLYVTYHFTSKENVQFSTTSFGYGGYGPGWGGWGYGYGGGMGSSTTTATTYTVGTLIIDGYEPTEKNLVWRGTGTVNVKDKPEKRVKQVEKILAKLGKRWDKIHAGEGK